MFFLEQEQYCVGQRQFRAVHSSYGRCFKASIAVYTLAVHGLAHPNLAILNIVLLQEAWQFVCPRLSNFQLAGDLQQGSLSTKFTYQL